MTAPWLCHSHPVLPELTPASNPRSSPVVFEVRLPGWQIFGVFMELHPTGIAKHSRSCWPGTSVPIGFLFLNEPFLQLGGEPVLLKSGGLMSSWWIFNDFFLISCRICSVFHLRHRVLVNRLLFGVAPLVAMEFKGTLAQLNKL